MTRYQYGISALDSQKSFGGKTGGGGVAKRRLLPLAKYDNLKIVSNPFFLSHAMCLGTTLVKTLGTLTQ